MISKGTFEPLPFCYSVITMLKQSSNLKKVEFSKDEEICFKCYHNIFNTDDSLTQQRILPPIAVSEQNLNFSAKILLHIYTESSA